MGLVYLVKHCVVTAENRVRFPGTTPSKCLDITDLEMDLVEVFKDILN